MIYWGEWSDDGSAKPIQEPSTAALTLAYQLTGQVKFAMRAFRSAAMRLQIARRVLRGGREHSDMGGAVCSVAAGHGRNWGQGAVTGCYGPLLLGTREIQSKVASLLETKDDEGPFLTDGLLVLVRPPLDNREAICLYNASDTPVSFSCRVSSVEWNEMVIGPDDAKNLHGHPDRST